MSHPSRPQARGPEQRRRRDLKPEAPLALEERALLTPVVTVAPRLAAFTAATNLPTGVNSGGVVVTLGQPDAGFPSAAPLVSVNQLTSLTAFGGDIVRIRTGPGGDFGKGVYAISRGAGANGLPSDSPLLANDLPRTITNAINRPGVIYRVDPATGKSSVFFDLNTVVSQLSPGATPGNSVGTSTGLVNWYDMTFDPEGYFDGRPSMFVASVDRSDPAKNAIYRIAPDGSFMGLFTTFTDGQTALKFNMTPSAITVAPPEDQAILRGLLSGAPQNANTGTSSQNPNGVSTTGGPFAAIQFDANQFKPGTPVTNGNLLPVGASETQMSLGPITGLTAANPDYLSRFYSAFSDFGTPAAGGIPANPGLSGVQGYNGELLINQGLFPNNFLTSTDSTITDKFPVATTDFRRFQDIGFDQYGYFAQGVNLNGTTTGTTNGGGGTGTGTGNGGSVGGTGAGGGSGSGVGQNLGAGVPGLIVVNGTFTVPTANLPPTNRGNLFVADLGTGLSVPVAIPNTNPAQTIRVPVQGPEIVTVTNLNGQITTTITPVGAGLGGRIVNITPDGTVRTFADNFNTSNLLDSQGFQLSSLSLSFSADGTTLYVADDDAIWQFKSVASLASSTAGSIVGLNDLRTLGVPYEGQDSAVAIVDTGVDANSSPFRGRVTRGTNVITNGPGNIDTANVTAGTNNNGGGGGGTGGGGNNTGNNATTPVGVSGHGTPVAGIVAQFVPQATIVPVNVFAPFITRSTSTTTGGGGGGGIGGGGGNGGTTLSGNSNTLTNSQALYTGFGWTASHPFVNDPVRPGKVNRVVAATLGFGTTETFNSEGVAYRRYPQIVIAFKNQLKKFRSLGIAPIAAAGQFGAPLGAGGGGNNGGGGGIGGGGGNGGGTANGVARNNAQNSSVGDVQGMAMPAILNEVISVTGTIPFPFVAGPATDPTNPTQGVLPFPAGPVLVPVVGGTGGTSTNGGNGGTGGGGTGNTNSTYTQLVSQLTNGNIAVYSDRIVDSSNRSVVTDFAAPAIDVPTFGRFAVSTTTGTGGNGGGAGGNGGTAGGGGVGTATNAAGNGFNFNVFDFGGTSASAAMVTGAYALVSSALNYWAVQNVTGVVVDGYLTGPVGVHALNYGPHAFKDMTAYNNPDGINAILQWTAVPVSDPNDGLAGSTPFNAIGSQNFRNYSRISVSNAIAAIEGQIALQWLIDHDQLKNIDSNNNGIITAQEIQDFVDTSSKTGNAEAGAMARLLGGTARTPASPGTTGLTLAGESPDQPDVLQRRFNFFDYAAHGSLKGGVTVDELKMLAHNLLPLPDSFVVNDRQRASANGYLLAPSTPRNFVDLQHIQPTYQFVPKSALAKFRGISPAKFHVDRGVPVGTTFPVYTLFDAGKGRTTKATGRKAGNTGGGAAVGGAATGGSTGGGLTSAAGGKVLLSTQNTAPTTAGNTTTTSTGSGSATQTSAAVNTAKTSNGESVTTVTPTSQGQTVSISGMTTAPVVNTPTTPTTPVATPTFIAPTDGTQAGLPGYGATLAQQAAKTNTSLLSKIKKLF